MVHTENDGSQSFFGFGKINNGALNVVHNIDVVSCLQVCQVNELIKLVLSVDATLIIEQHVSFSRILNDHLRSCRGSIRHDQFGLTSTSALDLRYVFLRKRLLDLNRGSDLLSFLFHLLRLCLLNSHLSLDKRLLSRWRQLHVYNLQIDTIGIEFFVHDTVNCFPQFLCISLSIFPESIRV